MRIISKYKDYYDGARAWMDEAIVYVRHSEIQDLPEYGKYLPQARYFKGPLQDDLAAPGLLNFCGKSFPYIKIRATDKMYTSFDDYRKAFEEEVRRQSTRRTRPFSFVEMYEDDLKAWLNTPPGALPDTLYCELGAPVFTVEAARQGAVVEINPVLKDTFIPALFHPWDAFQEISMFVGNILVNTEDPNIERSDELIRDQKGFDDWSFRRIGKKGKQ